MAKRKIIWSPEASRQFNEILRYYNNRNKSKIYSRKLRNLLQESICLLQKQPRIGKFLSGNYNNYRVLFIARYHLFYEITDSFLYIHDIWDGRRNPENIKYYKKED
ncbi:MAG: type II toxin-antitoxin system RelE/ParE family toxin [Prevotellaceae bacterium]|jgi:toxin YoeB|nr:type II toxin-antitoxin system RelE/ParE family toxin [Prevotellaceae bacterium]